MKFGYFPCKEPAYTIAFFRAFFKKDSRLHASGSRNSDYTGMVLSFLSSMVLSTFSC